MQAGPMSTRSVRPATAASNVNASTRGLTNNASPHHTESNTGHASTASASANKSRALQSPSGTARFDSVMPKFMSRPLLQDGYYAQDCQHKGVRGGREDLPPVMFGSHIDTVGTGGRYDGLYGVLAGLEACAALNDAGRSTRRPLALVAFTNEEGSRFAPYAMGSLVYVGGVSLDDAYAVRGIDGTTVGEELRRIGYVGDAKPGFLTPHAYLELHIEQGPVLESEGLVIGAVEGITGLSWTEVSITGRSAHAGTTPMHLRRDAACAAGEIALFVRRLAQNMGGHQKGTVGRIELYPNLVNVIAERALLTIDLRNPDESLLQEAERQLAGFLDRLAVQEQMA